MDASPIPRGYSWNDTSPDGIIEQDFLERLEARFEKILGRLDRATGADLAQIRLDVRELCNEVTHSDLPVPHIGVERNRLLQPDWEQAWAETGQIYWALFVHLRDLLSADHIDYLYAVFQQLVRFVAEGKTDHIRRRLGGDLREALGDGTGSAIMRL